MTATGGAIATVPCLIALRTWKIDGGALTTAFDFESTRLPSIEAMVAFGGRPTLGRQVAYPAGPALFASAKLTSASGVEWEAATFCAQGMVDIILTSGRPVKQSGVDTYEIHGTIEAELPYANLPVGNPTLPVTLQISF